MGASKAASRALSGTARSRRRLSHRRIQATVLLQRPQSLSYSSANLRPAPEFVVVGCPLGRQVRARNVLADMSFNVRKDHDEE